MISLFWIVNERVHLKSIFVNYIDCWQRIIILKGVDLESQKRSKKALEYPTVLL